MVQHYAIIVAAGKGERMQTTIPKQFLLLNNKPVLSYSIQAFLTAIPDVKIIIVSHKDYFQECDSIARSFEKYNIISIVEGGNSRFQSVKNGLNAIPNSNGSLVFIHDAARPLITPSLIVQLQNDAVKNGNAIPVIAVHESLRGINNHENFAVDRNLFKIVQTPQVAFLSKMKEAFHQEEQNEFTDEATVLESIGEKIFLSNGDSRNIKITTPEQLPIVMAILQA